MRTTRLLWGRLAVLAVLAGLHLVAAGRAAPLPKDDDKQLRDKAIELNRITGDDAVNGAILTLIDDKEGSKKLLAAAHALAKEKGKDQPFNSNATYILALTAHRLKEVDIAEYFYRRNIDQAEKVQAWSKLARGFNNLISLFYENKRFDDSEKVCKEFLEKQGDEELTKFKRLAVRNMIRIQAKQGKIEQALKMVDGTLRRDPDNLLMREMKGWVQREAGKYQEAAETYEDLLERIGKDDRLDKEQKDAFGGDIRYTLSGVYIDLKKVEKAAEHLKVLLAKDEKNPTYNNDLGYIWADHGLNLDEAEKLVRRAIDEDRKIRKKIGDLPKSEDHDNPAYLDSLGWVLYKQKKFKEALEALTEAVKHEEGQHLEIYDHLAEVHIALEQKDKALEAWKKGLACPPVSKRDESRKKEVEKKMKMHEGK